MLQENFNEFLENIKEGISHEEEKVDIKKDISLILGKTLSNLVNIHHYDEIGGYLNKNKNISEFWIMRNDEAKKI